MNANLPRDSSYFVDQLQKLAARLVSSVDAGIRSSTADELAEPIGNKGGDTIFRLDEHGERPLLSYCADWSQEYPFLLIAEGLDNGQVVFPSDAVAESLAFTLIVDPIDGTRELMYGKRSAWALFGIAPAPRRAWQPTLADIDVALQAELPTVRAALADTLWAARGEGVQAQTMEIATGAITSFVPRPSRAPTLEGGFSTISKFFPGAKTQTARLEEKLFLELLGPPSSESPQVFDDEYIATGGQLYELLMGHDRFIADLRPLLHSESEIGMRLCCHPYDLCTTLIAQEAGIVVTDGGGGILNAPLDTNTAVSWVGYANTTLRASIEPILLRLLAEGAHDGT